LLWALLAIFIPNAIGIILYFILRDPLLQYCSKCGAGSQASFTFCSVCGEPLSETCPGCRGTVQPGWSHCARCGASLPAA
jgi:predicted amidophosphoribosyltransferase